MKAWKIAGVAGMAASGMAMAMGPGCSAGAEPTARVREMALEASEGDIVQTAAAAGSFKTLATLLEKAGLVDALKGSGPFTVFAPTDEAFAKLPKETVESLLKPENKARLAGILLYHVVPGKLASKDVETSGAGTLNGQRLDVVVKDGKVMVDGASVRTADVAASNGVIHAIDAVVMPSDLDIVETAAAAGSFKTLATLLEKAGLVDALKGSGPFTVFAPTDEAFAKLPKETVESLLRPENKEKLAGILKYHVVSGRVFSEAAAAGAEVATLQGQKVVTQGSSGKVMVQGATVTKADIDASNGVIHVIDAVILPR